MRKVAGMKPGASLASLRGGSSDGGGELLCHRWQAGSPAQHHFWSAWSRCVGGTKQPPPIECHPEWTPADKPLQRLPPFAGRDTQGCGGGPRSVGGRQQAMSPRNSGASSFA